MSTDDCILFSYFFCSLISVFKKQNIEEMLEEMLTFPYSYNWQKFNNEMNEKRHSEYVTGKINSCILELLLRRFYCSIFAPP